MIDIYFIADTLSESLRRHYPDTELAALGVTFDVLLDREDIIGLLQAPICEHGLPTVGECRPCGMTATLSEMYQRICFAKVGKRMSDDDAWLLAKMSLNGEWIP